MWSCLFESSHFVHFLLGSIAFFLFKKKLFHNSGGLLRSGNERRYHSGHPKPHALMNCTGGVSDCLPEKRDLCDTFSPFLWWKVEIRIINSVAEWIFCKVTITGNQGADVCCAGRQCVPLRVYTNSILWLGLGYSAVWSRKVPLSVQTACVHVVLPMSLMVCLQHIVDLVRSRLLSLQTGLDITWDCADCFLLVWILSNQEGFGTKKVENMRDK